MQGGYNGWHNDVACNLLTPRSEVGPCGTGGRRYGSYHQRRIHRSTSGLVHVVNFNDLESVESGLPHAIRWRL